MSNWNYTTTVNPNGYGMFFVHAWRKKGEVPTDITFFRDVPVIIESLTYADPFGDATASFRFPQITGFDGPYTNPPYNNSPSDTVWLQEYTNIDVIWVPATSVANDRPVLNPSNQTYTLYLHEEDAIPVWEGFIESIEPSTDGVTVQCKGALYQLDRYFAKPLNPLRPKLVEEMIERYFDPRRRGLWTQPLEIDFNGWNKVYTMTDYNNFKTQGMGSLRYVPTGFTQYNETTFSQQTGDRYAANIGKPWTGYVTRNTGSWERALTGYIQGQLGILWTDPGSGDVLIGGDQWTITKKPYRKPWMYVRRQSADPTLVAMYGQPGVEARLTRDGAQNNNIVYGIGKNYAESEWTTFSQPFGTWTAWKPLAQDGDEWLNGEKTATGDIWHGEESAWTDTQADGTSLYSKLYDGYDAEYERTHGIPVTERFSNFPDGVSYGDGQQIATRWIQRDSDPGWSGTIELKVDLRDWNDQPVSKWMIRPGDIILLRYFNGTTGDPVQGVNKFHISQVEMHPMDGVVVLTVDTKFRDLLSVEEAIARGRDSLSPIKSLQVGKKSVMIQDLALPWNYQRSGFVPVGSSNGQITGSYPYEEWAIAHPPSSQFPRSPDFLAGIRQNQPRNMPLDNETLANGSNLSGSNIQKLEEIFYVPIKADDPDMSNRWAFIEVPLSQAGTISLSEFAVYDRTGHIYPAEFHVSVWNTKVDCNAMPKEPHDYMNPQGGTAGIGVFWSTPDGKAFDQINNDGTTMSENGSVDIVHWYAGASADFMIIGWGDNDRPCGYYPRMKGDPNAQVTGLFQDASTWSYDFSQYITHSSAKNAKPEAYSVWVAFHIQQYTNLPGNTKYLYMMGRFYRKVEI